jgi:hypothetical protein
MFVSFFQPVESVNPFSAKSIDQFVSVFVGEIFEKASKEAEQEIRVYFVKFPRKLNCTQKSFPFSNHCPLNTYDQRFKN